jgi:cellulose synthase (UDP-forming)
MSLLGLTDRSREADASARLIRSGGFPPPVDVFVPTYSESVDMLRRTLIGCQAMDYPHKTIYLLDDQRRPAMKELAAELGCHYLDRPDNRHAKAGNLNHALARTRGEFILCFDADFVPTTDFLDRTLGFFTDPTVAMVQTPQNFFNDDAASRNLGLEGVLQDEQRFFFRTLQPGRDAANALVCHGSCFVVRRTALEDIGGIPTETITEDWATSIKLQAAGYKLLYLNEALSAGASADRCGEFLQQRARWAQGTLQAVFSSANPLTAPGLNLKQRLFHFSGILYYLGSLSSMFNLVAPLLYLVLGLRLLDVTLPELLFYRLPFMVGYYMLFCWLTCRNRSAVWTEFFDAFLAPTLAWTALRTLWKPFGKGFRVTDKSMNHQGLTWNRPVARPFLVLLGLHVGALVLAWSLGRHEEDPHLFVIVAWFALGNILILWLCLLATMDVARHHAHPRFHHNLPAAVDAPGRHWTGRTVTVSEGEVVMETSPPLTRDELASITEATLTLEMPGLERMPARVRVRPDGGEGNDRRLALEFIDLPLEQRRNLIEFLFCQPGQWDRGHTPRNELRSVSEFYRSALRVYPLAESA